MAFWLTHIGKPVVVMMLHLSGNTSQRDISPSRSHEASPQSKQCRGMHTRLPAVSAKWLSTHNRHDVSKFSLPGSVSAK